MYRMFQKELYNFETLYIFIQRTCSVFWTVIMWENTPNFAWNSYGSMWLALVMQGVSEIALQWYYKCYCVASVTKKVYTKRRTNYPSFNALNRLQLQSSFLNNLNYQWKLHSTVRIAGKTRYLLLHYDSSKHCTYPLNKCI
jgi:hypothetical protein